MMSLRHCSNWWGLKTPPFLLLAVQLSVRGLFTTVAASQVTRRTLAKMQLGSPEPSKPQEIELQSGNTGVAAKPQWQKYQQQKGHTQGVGCCRYVTQGQGPSGAGLNL
jgi:hypothetical protein